MIRVLDGYLIRQASGRPGGSRTSCPDRRLGHTEVLDGYLIGGAGRRAGRVENRGHRAEPEWALTGLGSGEGTP